MSANQVPTKLAFTKMHGLGNDFMMVDATQRPLNLSREQITQLADRNFGVGFDQLLTVEPAQRSDVDFSYRIFNVDGGEVEHCGNGARCFAAFVYQQGLSSKNPLTVATVNRTLTISTGEDGWVTVDMGTPSFDFATLPFSSADPGLVQQRELAIGGGADQPQTRTVSFIPLSMGNPHAVIQVEELDDTAVKEIGSALGSHPDFPDGVNVGFMQLIDRQHIKLVVFERGTGITLACGTGACAAVVAGRSQGLLDETVEVQLPGGQLRINWAGEGASVKMSGPVSTVYTGEVQL